MNCSSLSINTSGSICNCTFFIHPPNQKAGMKHRNETQKVNPAQKNFPYKQKSPDSKRPDLFAAQIKKPYKRPVWAANIKITS